jgi:hypothetical protein
MDTNSTILENIERICPELSTETERYRQSVENDDIFEVRRRILSRIRVLEKELDKLYQEHSIHNKPRI